MKIQYPGVAKSIDSDIDNLMSVLNVWNILPKKLYIDSFIDVAKRELALECDYRREAEYSERFRELLNDDPVFKVPEYIPELSTDQVLTTEYVPGYPLDQCVHLDQETRDWVSSWLDFDGYVWCLMLTRVSSSADRTAVAEAVFAGNLRLPGNADRSQLVQLFLRSRIRQGESSTVLLSSSITQAVFGRIDAGFFSSSRSFFSTLAQRVSTTGTLWTSTSR